MNRIEEAIALLEAERRYIDRALESLRQIPALQNGNNSPRRRGRHPGDMDESERLRVSARMKAYWANRRGERTRGGAA